MRKIHQNAPNGEDSGAALKRRTVLQSTGLSALTLGAGCIGGVGNDDNRIQIGSLVAFPEDQPAGMAQKSASELAVEQINQNGGLLGEEIELVIKDTEMDPANARTQYRELILDDGVDATFGLYSSEEGLAPDRRQTNRMTLTKGR